MLQPSRTMAEKEESEWITVQSEMDERLTGSVTFVFQFFYRVPLTLITFTSQVELDDAANLVLVLLSSRHSDLQIWKIGNHQFSNSQPYTYSTFDSRIEGCTMLIRHHLPIFHSLNHFGNKDHSVKLTMKKNTRNTIEIMMGKGSL